MVIIDLANTQ